jgi:hypothetical protein
MAELQGWVAKLEGWEAQLEGWVAESDNGWLLMAKDVFFFDTLFKDDRQPFYLRLSIFLMNGIMYFRSRTCLEHKRVSAATKCFRIVDSGQNGSENRANFITILYLSSYRSKIPKTCL